MFQHEHGEQADIGADVKNDLAFAQVDSVPEINPFLEYFAINVFGFRGRMVKNIHAIGSSKYGKRRKYGIRHAVRLCTQLARVNREELPIRSGSLPRFIQTFAPAPISPIERIFW